MTVTSERYVVNEAGERIAVLLDMAAYGKLLDALEEIESIRAYDTATADSRTDAVPFEQAVREIDQDRE